MGVTAPKPVTKTLMAPLVVTDAEAQVRFGKLAEAQPGEFRVFNQFTEQFSVLDLALTVQSVARQMGLKVEIDHLPDPRVEAESHYYNARHSRLADLGLKPHLLSDSLVDSLITIALRYRDRIDPALFAPQVNWRSTKDGRRIGSETSKQPLLAKSIV